MQFIGVYIKEAQDAYAESGSIAEESIGSIKTVTTFGLQEHFSNRYDTTIKNSMSFGIKSGVYGG